MPTGNTSPILPPEWLDEGEVVYCIIIVLSYTYNMHTHKRVNVHVSACV